jgi:hypothetical protein
MAIQATDSGAVAQKYTFDPTQGKVVPIEQARVVTYVTVNSDGTPDTVSPDTDELLKKQGAAAADKAAADKKARIELDPDVIAAKANQKAAEEEVAATQKSLSQALADLEAFGNAANGEPQVEVTQELRDATQGLDTNAGFITGAVDVREFTGPIKPVGTPPAYIYDPATKTWVMPPKPEGAGTWVFDANKGWVNTTVVPGPTGFRADGTQTLAIDTFRNTLALLFGAKEVSQPWVTALFDSASKFYNSGSTIDEAINLSLQDIRYNEKLKPFTDRFKGIYALTDRLAKGEAVTVPTVAEYFKSEAAMGEVLTRAGMGELATQDFLGGIIGLGKSVLAVTNLITDTFDRIDNAPSALKADLQAFFPGADRTSIAKAMLLGDKGAAELTKKVKQISVQSAAKTQGVTVNDLVSGDLAGQGYDYNESLTNFATVKQLERGQTLGRMSNIDFTQQEAIASTFQSNAAAAEKIRRIKEEETNRFRGSSGRFSSKDRAQGLI